MHRFQRRMASVLIALFVVSALASPASAGPEFTTITTQTLSAAEVETGVDLTSSGSVVWVNPGGEHSVAQILGTPVVLTLHSGSDCAGDGTAIDTVLTSDPGALFSKTFAAPPTAGTYSVKATFLAVNAGGSEEIFAHQSSDCDSFVVTSGGTNGTCSAPAAPAWAAHILKANVLKPKGKPQPDGNYVAMVADEMGPGTLFQTVPKIDGLAYGTKVRDYLNTKVPTAAQPTGGLVLPTGWPPNLCVTV